jgi:hypothetical protein
MTRLRPFHPTWIILLVIAFSLACASTPDSRIKKEQSLFDSYPVDVQSNIRQGKVDLGFDETMVRLALGDPDETSTEVSDEGETLMWGYTRSRPGVSIGLGGGSFGGSSAVGGGVGMGSGPKKDYTSIVEFREGRVTNVRHFDN